jgi:putative transcriptional regulator
MKPAPNAWGLKGEKPQAPLHYTDCGLDDVYLVSGYEIEDSHYGKSLSIKNLDELHQAIGCYLVREKKVLTAKELRFLRTEMDLTQSEMGKLLGLSSQQVARWEKGESEISGAADLLMRAYFMQHVGKTVDLQKLANTLEDIDAPMKDAKVSFENTPNGWKPLKKAA